MARSSQRLDIVVSDWIFGLVGGALIGLSATILLLFNGRIAGISGILGAVVNPEPDDLRWRLAFLLGMVLTGFGIQLLAPAALGLPPVDRTLGVVVAAGLLVGFGTRLGNGCTSGHGICGLSRLSVRSLAAVLSFMVSGAVTVFLFRTLGGAS